MVRKKRETLGSRIKDVLSEIHMTQAELARLVGVKQQTISYICSHSDGAESSRYTVRIAEILGVNPAWLQSGTGEKHDPVVRIQVNGIELLVARVPLLDYEDVSGYLAGETLHKARRELMTDAKTGGRSFAIEIHGESMEPLFREGDRVVIDPDLHPEPGDFVCAGVGGLITFRKYRAKGVDRFELVPLNQDWPTTDSTDGAEIIGVMTEHRTYRRR